jgi:FlaA1/EpsC-like NDP-sugar epimerase
VRLVLHCGAVGESGDLCIQDMGDPVRIATLAENMIRMAEKRPFEDIEIEFAGIRSGEQLAEELFPAVEAGALRELNKILICRPERSETDVFRRGLGRLRESYCQKLWIGRSGNPGVDGRKEESVSSG